MILIKVYASRFWCEWDRVSGDNPVAFYVPLLEYPHFGFSTGVGEVALVALPALLALPAVLAVGWFRGAWVPGDCSPTHPAKKKD